MDEQMIERLETKLSFLERSNHELSDELYRQRQELDAVKTRLSSLLSRLDEGGGQAVPGSAEQERPPHY